MRIFLIPSRAKISTTRTISSIAVVGDGNARVLDSAAELVNHSSTTSTSAPADFCDNGTAQKFKSCEGGEWIAGQRYAQKILSLPADNRRIRLHQYAPKKFLAEILNHRVRNVFLANRNAAGRYQQIELARRADFAGEVEAAPVIIRRHLPVLISPVKKSLAHSSPTILKLFSVSAEFNA